MNAKRKIEIFSAGCPACEETISRSQDLTCKSGAEENRERNRS